MLQNIGEHLLLNLDNSIQITPRRLSLDMPVLGQMSTSPRLFSSKRRRDRIDAANARNQRLSIELPALSKVRFFLEILHLKQSSTSLNSSRCEDGNLYLQEATRVKPGPRRRQNRGTYLQNSPHLIATDKQMALIEEKLWTMKLLRNRKLVQRRILNLASYNLNLPPSRRTRIKSNGPFQVNSRLHLG